jgi:Spy/CpxP family protein refolding chaperone
MNNKVFVLIAMAVMIPVWAADAPSPAEPTADQVVEQFRTDLQSQHADIMAKGLTLTSDQAAKFWPLYEQFQKEQTAIVDEQLKAIQKYSANVATLTDADALAYVKALLERDAKMQQLRVTWLAKFQTVVPVKTAARAIHIERRLGLVTQLKLASKIPLVQ